MFNYDLRKGEAVEDEFVSLLKIQYPNKEIKKSRVGEKTFDISVDLGGYTLLYEVKADFKSESTRNIAIEYQYKQKPSGIATTKADYWVQLSGKTFYILNAHDLREELRLNWLYYKKVTGGDENQSHLVLLPLSRLRNFSFLQILSKQPEH